MAPMKLRQIFADNLVRIRKAKGLSQEGLALEAGIDRSYVSLLERAKFNASLEMLEAIGKALDVDPAILIAKPERRR